MKPPHCPKSIPPLRSLCPLRCNYCYAMIFLSCASNLPVLPACRRADWVLCRSDFPGGNYSFASSFFSGFKEGASFRHRWHAAPICSRVAWPSHTATP